MAVGPTYKAFFGSSSSAYVGPGDIVSGAWAAWMLRAYNRSAAMAHLPAIDVVDAATGAITTTINVRLNGQLDVAAIVALGYAVKVAKVYDQTGNGRHVSQSTLANMPALTLSGLGPYPVMTFTGSEWLETGNLAKPADTGSATWVANSQSASAGTTLLGSEFAAIQLQAGNGSARWFASPDTISVAATEFSWHSIQAQRGGGGGNNSTMYADGVAGTAGDLGFTGMNSTTNIGLGGIGGSGGGGSFIGQNVEMIWYSSTQISSTDAAQVASNQSAFWFPAGDILMGQGVL